MATIQDYLAKKRQEQPYYQRYSDVTLYNILKGSDKSLPSWQALDNIATQAEQSKKFYEKTHNPSFVNSLYDWTDYGIDDMDYNWVKRAYNESITGLSYQLVNGNQRFAIDDKWEPGVLEDIGSAVLGFMMPLDLASMWVGGWAGKAGLAGISSTKSVQNTAVKKLMEKGFSKELAESTVKNAVSGMTVDKVNNTLVKGGLMARVAGKSTVGQMANPILSGGFLQGATLATFEGARGGLQASVNGEDIWSGIGHGVAHGGLMGGLAGMVGASLNIANSSLYAKSLERTLTTGEKVAKASTGAVGQVVAESTAFSAPDAVRVITDDTFTSKDLIRNFAVNAGMMGILKAKKKVLEKSFKTVNEFAEEYRVQEGTTYEKMQGAGKEVLNNMREGASESSSLKNIKAMEKVGDKYLAEALKGKTIEIKDKDGNIKEVEFTIEMYKDLVKRQDGLLKDIELLEKGKLDIGKISADKYIDYIRLLHEVKSGLENKIKRHKNDVDLKKGKIDELTKLLDVFEQDIFEPLRNFKRGQKPKPMPSSTKKFYENKLIDAVSQLSKAKNKIQIKQLIEGNESAITIEKGKITNIDKDAINHSILKENIDVYEKSRPKDKIISDVKGDRRNLDDASISVEDKLNYRISDKKGETDTRISSKDRIRELEQKLSEFGKDEISTEKDAMARELMLLKEGQAAQSENPFTGEKGRKYELNKPIFAWLAEKLNKELKGKDSKPIQDIQVKKRFKDQVKFAKWLADKHNKSLYELTDKEIVNYFQSGVGKKSHKSFLMQLIRVVDNKLGITKRGAITYDKPAQLEALVPSIVGTAQPSPRRGFRTSFQKGIEKVWKIGKDFIEFIVPKTQVKVKKYITPEVSRKLNKLHKNTDGEVGHNQFMFRDVLNHAITSERLRPIVQWAFGVKEIPKKGFGEQRAFRYSFMQWAIEKYGIGSEASQVLKLVLKDKPPTESDLRAVYGAKKYNLDADAKGWVKEYLSDIKNGGYTKDGKFVKFKKDKNKAGYTPQEIKTGLDKIASKGNVVKIPVEFNKKGKPTKYEKVSKETLEAMFGYMIQTAPRINEIVPTESLLSKTIKEAGGNLQKALKNAEKIIKAQETTDIVKWANNTYKELSIEFRKSLGKVEGDYVLGRISGHLIEIAQGKARVDTIPHEVSHYVVDALKSSGDKASKALVRKGIKLFGGEENLVDALGKYTSKRVLDKTTTGKMKSWVTNVVNYFRQKLGISNRNDVDRVKSEIVSLLGEKVYKGKIPSNYMPTAQSIAYKYQVGKKAKPALKKAHDATYATIRELKKKGVSEKNILDIIKDETGIDGFPNINKNNANTLTISQYEALNTKLAAVIFGRGEGKSPKQSKNESKIVDIEMQYNVQPEVRENFFNKVYNTSFKNASKSQVNAYRAYIMQGKKANVMNTAASEFQNSYKGESPGMNSWARPFMTVGDVLLKWGGKWGKRLHRDLDIHDYVRTVYYGEFTNYINSISKIVDRKTRNKYMHLMDKEMAKNAIKQLTELSKKDKKYAKELEVVKDIANKFDVKVSEGGFKEARDIWEKMSKGAWNSLSAEIAKNTNAMEMHQIMKDLNATYVNNYFTRRVRGEVLRNIDSKHSSIQKLANEIRKNLSKEDLKKIKEKSKSHDSIEDYIANQIFDMYQYGPVKVNPFFLKKRGALLPEYIEITKNGSKKLVKSYESSVDATMNHYALGMARFLATVRLFPEWTNLGGKFSLESGKKRDIIEMMKQDKNVGGYAIKALERQLGLDQTSADRLNDPYIRLAGKVTNVNAVMGLSSPTSGIKNFLIQVPRSVYLYGTRNTVRALAKTMSIVNDPVKYSESIKQGTTGYGSKQVFEEARVGKQIRWIFKNVNLMEKSENFNRIMLAEAGKMHFSQMLAKARGNKISFHPNGRKNEINRYLKEVYRLTEKDIDFAVNTKDVYGTKKYADILNWVGFQAHKRGAGATGTADLPLWMSNKYGKPLTLFQRIATSVTIDTYKNVVKPMYKSGNFAPLIKATIGHGIAGAALYTMYETLFDQQPPKEESDFIDKAVSYIWRGEALGMFGELISPYDRGLSAPIMEPVVVRNGKLAWDNARRAMKGTKSWNEAVKDFTTKAIVLAGQGDRVFTKVNHPYVSKYKKLKTLERTWRDENNLSKGTSTGEATKKQIYYWNLKKAILLGKTDEEIASAYYNAFNYLVHEKEHQGETSLLQRVKDAKSSLNRVTSLMNPIGVSDKKNARNRFLKSLSKENYNMAIWLEKEYNKKMSKLSYIQRQLKYKEKYSLYPNY